MITIELKSDEISAGLARAEAALGDTTPLMKQIAEILTTSTKKRFATGKSPAGVVWASKSAATKAKYERGKDPVDPRPLFGPSLQLSRQIFPEHGRDWAEVGSNRPYAAMMHFGGSKTRFLHLWGDIPARPFLGISAEDQTNVLAEIGDHILAAWRG